MADLISMLAAVGGSGGGADPNFNQTVLLLHGDGTNGAQNNTFLDSSSNNFTITRNGNTTQGTFSPFSLAAGEWSNYFDNSGDYLQISSNAAFSFGTSDFTIEAWFYANSLATLAAGGDGIFTAIGSVGFYVASDGIRATQAGTAVLKDFATTISPNTWYHVALTRSGTSMRAFLNGVQVDTTLTNSTNFSNTGNVRIGTETNQDFHGYISNLRVLKGTAQYTSAFTPPTAPLTAITNTSLLTCQSNRFVDNSTNAFAITRNGDVRVTPFSPFAPTAAYSAGTNGGSGYFDGSGDYLSVASNAAFDMGSGDFTLEGWFYATGSLASKVLFSVGTASSPNRSVQVWLGGSSSVEGYFSQDGVNWFSYVASGTTLVQSTWYHVAFVKSGTTLKLYVNGKNYGSQVGTATGSAYSGQTVGIGSDPTQYGFIGYLADVRFVKGTAVYTSEFTPPTTPLTAISNTSLLINFTNAGIIDNTGKNNLETVGNAQIDTTIKKFGTGSLEFDGTGDWLLMPNTPDQQLGTGNFTIEFWVYLATGDTGSARGLVAKGTSTTGWLVSLDSSQKVVFTYTTSTITSSGAITTNAWNHIAVVRSGTGSNQTKIYIGGTNDGTGTVSTDFNQTSVMYVGANRTGGDPMKGFIDDLRITKGVARYTANFNPPTAAFPNE